MPRIPNIASFYSGEWEEQELIDGVDDVAGLLVNPELFDIRLSDGGGAATDCNVKYQICHVGLGSDFYTGGLELSSGHRHHPTSLVLFRQIGKSYPSHLQERFFFTHNHTS